MGAGALLNVGAPRGELASSRHVTIALWYATFLREPEEPVGECQVLFRAEMITSSHFPMLTGCVPLLVIFCGATLIVGTEGAMFVSMTLLDLDRASSGCSSSCQCS